MPQLYMMSLHLGYHFSGIIFIVEVQVKVVKNLKPDWYQHSIAVSRLLNGSGGFSEAY